MPLTKSAKKALRMDQSRTLVNRRIKNIMKLAVKAFRVNPASESLSKAYQAIDRAAKKNLIHKKKGGRLKSQLSKLVSVAK